MVEKVISVVGSWRPTEHEDRSLEAKKRFNIIAKKLGEILFKEGSVLRIVWSNDHLPMQCAPKDDKGGWTPKKINKDGTYEIDRQDVRYLFEDTPDFLALVGFIKAGQKKKENGQSARIELLISDEMWSGTKIPKTFQWNPVSDMKIGDETLGSLVEQGFIARKTIDGALKEPPYARSLQLGDLVNGENPVDAVLILGGGKATRLLAQAQGAQERVIPLPFCESVGWDVLKKIYETPNKTHEQIKNIFGNVLESKEYYATLNSEKVASFLEDKLFGFFRPSSKCALGMHPSNSL